MREAVIGDRRQTGFMNPLRVHKALTADIEKRAILHAIALLNGDKLEAAKQLGIGKTTLYRKLKEYGAAV